jgi:hypothetical protein
MWPSGHNERVRLPVTPRRCVAAAAGIRFSSAGGITTLSSVVDSGARGQQRRQAGAAVMPAQQQVHRVRPPGRRRHHRDDQRPGQAASGTLGECQRPCPADAVVSRAATQLATASNIKLHAARHQHPGRGGCPRQYPRRSRDRYHRPNRPWRIADRCLCHPVPPRIGLRPACRVQLARLARAPGRPALAGIAQGQPPPQVPGGGLPMMVQRDHGGRAADLRVPGRARAAFRIRHASAMAAYVGPVSGPAPFCTHRQSVCAPLDLRECASHGARPRAAYRRPSTPSP